MRKRKTSIGVVLALVATVLVWLAPAASAACHRFSLEVSPTSASEGDTVTVTVGRDGSVADSSVRVAATGQSAESGSDFSALDEQITFTGSELEETFTIDIVADDEEEPSETFAVGLSDPGGCSVNPNFSLADDATVTIAAAEGGAPAEADPQDDPAAPDDSEDLGGIEDDAADDEDEDEEDGGMTTGLIIAAVIVLVAAGGFLAFKKRSSA